MVAPTHIKQVVTALPSLEGPEPLPQTAAKDKKPSSCKINCLARAAFMGPQPLSPSTFMRSRSTCSELTDDQDMGSVKFLAIPIKIGAWAPQKVKLNRGYS